jgi:phospholipid-binding lipoprotein MlaA
MTVMPGFSMRKQIRRMAFSAALVLSLSGGALAQDVADPLEGFNRSMFSVNEVLDKYALRPVAQAYDTVSPLPVKAGVGNFFGNVGELWVGANSALQGKVEDAGAGLARFLINSTVGIFGLFDVASELGFERYNEDFGQTLAVWGVGDGPYLFLPLIGPRTSRDFAGWAVDTTVDPVAQIDPDSVRMGVNVLRVVDIRAGLLPTDKVVEEAAIDKYSYIRDAYLQRRNSLIFDGRPPRQDY